MNVRKNRCDRFELYVCWSIEAKAFEWNKQSLLDFSMQSIAMQSQFEH